MKNNLKIDDLLKISLYYTAQQNKTEYKLKQITKFDWLSEHMLNEGIDRLKKVVGHTNKLVFEESVEKNFNGILIFGEIDCIDITNKISYELKCTKTLTNNHIIQTTVYKYLYDKSDKNRLYNIFTNELIDISISDENLKKMIKILIEHKTSETSNVSDTEFLENITKLKLN